jgi:hypothetical protein
VEFCSPFDEQLARHGPAGVFLLDPEGAWRFDANWSRDAWQRSPESHVVQWRFVLLRDRGSGFVQLALTTSPTLLAEHPRSDVRQYRSLEEALAERERFGDPPLCAETW